MRVAMVALSFVLNAAAIVFSFVVAIVILTLIARFLGL